MQENKIAALKAAKQSSDSQLNLLNNQLTNAVKNFHTVHEKATTENHLHIEVLNEKIETQKKLINKQKTDIMELKQKIEKFDLENECRKETLDDLRSENAKIIATLDNKNVLIKELKASIDSKVTQVSNLQAKLNAPNNESELLKITAGLREEINSRDEEIKKLKDFLRKNFIPLRQGDLGGVQIMTLN